MKVRYLTNCWEKITGEKEFKFAPSTRAMIKAAPTLMFEEFKNWRVRQCDREDANLWVPYMIHPTSNGTNFPRVLYAHIRGSENILELVFKKTVPNITITEWDGYNPTSVKYAVQGGDDKTEKPSLEELQELKQMYAKHVGDGSLDGEIDWIELLKNIKLTPDEATSQSGDDA